MKPFIKTLLLIASLGWCAHLFASGDHGHGHDDHQDDEPKKGAHNGRLLEDGDFVVELAIYERDVPPEYRAWATLDGKSLKPSDWKLEVQLTRLGGEVNTFAFKAEQDFLRGQGVVEEPHSFDVKVTATYQNKQHQWTYPSYEGRITMATEVAAASALTTAIAGEGVLQERIKLYGTIVPDPLRVSHIQARYPGLIRSVKPPIGTRVKAGETLATVESNESLREYPLLAPIDGVVVERHANPGEFTADRVLFTLLDDRVLELHLQAFPGDASKLKTGQAITVSGNGQQAQTQTEFITPRHGETPALEVHAPIDNSQNQWVPNQAVEGWVDIAQVPVALMVDNRALQSFRDWQVVFIEIADSTSGINTYEIRPLELGRTDGHFTEVLSGLNAGDRYVVENSFLLKADLEKSGASHDH
jgi:cobalt-zinc-cadmium efflux system membrane fusion protein